MTDHNPAVDDFCVHSFSTPHKRVGRGGWSGFKIRLQKFRAIGGWNQRAPLRCLIGGANKPRHKRAAIIHAWTNPKLTFEQIEWFHFRQRLHALQLGRKLAHVLAQRLRAGDNGHTDRVRRRHVYGFDERHLARSAPNRRLILRVRMRVATGDTHHYGGGATDIRLSKCGARHGCSFSEMCCG